MTDEPPVHPSSVDPGRARHLAPLGEDSTEVLLRHRDVQALSRSFRHLGEVQQELLAEMRRQRRGYGWWLGAVAVGALVLGAGLAWIGAAWLQQPTTLADPQAGFSVEEWAAALAALQQQAEDASNGTAGLDPALFDSMIARLEEIAAGQREDRHLVEALGDRLVNGEMAALEALQRLQNETPASADAAASSVVGGAAETGEVAAKAVHPDSASAPEPHAVEASGQRDPDPGDPADFGYPPDAWLGALNGLLVADGYGKYRFQSGQRVAGQPALTDVVLFQWGTDGLLQGIVEAERATFQLQEEAWSLLIHLTGGSRNFDGVRTALPAGGLRVFLPEVRARAWLAHFPELALDLSTLPSEDSSPAVEDQVNAEDLGPKDDLPEQSTPAKGDPSVEGVRRALDALLQQPQAFGHYRLRELREIRAGALHRVVVAWFNREGDLVKHIEADRLRLLLHQDGWVELRFDQGSFRQGDNRMPFRGDSYRLHLTGQDFAAWQDTGAPLEKLD